MEKKAVVTVYLQVDENGKEIVKIPGKAIETPINLIKYLNQEYRKRNIQYGLELSYRANLEDKIATKGNKYTKYVFEKKKNSSESSLFIVAVPNDEMDKHASTIQALKMFKTNKVQKLKINFYRVAALAAAGFVLISPSLKSVLNKEEPKSDEWIYAHNLYEARLNEERNGYIREYNDNIRSIAYGIIAGTATESEIAEFKDHLLSKGIITEENLDDYKKYAASIIADDSFSYPAEENIPEVHHRY